MHVCTYTYTYMYTHTRMHVKYCKYYASCTHVCTAIVHTTYVQYIVNYKHDLLILIKLAVTRFMCINNITHM
jgi:hypothetical protein